MLKASTHSPELNTQDTTIHALADSLFSSLRTTLIAKPHTVELLFPARPHGATDPARFAGPETLTCQIVSIFPRKETP